MQRVMGREEKGHWRVLIFMLATLVVSLSLAAPVLAGPYEEGKAAFNRGDYKKAAALQEIEGLEVPLLEGKETEG